MFAKIELKKNLKKKSKIWNQKGGLLIIKGFDNLEEKSVETGGIQKGVHYSVVRMGNATEMWRISSRPKGR